MIKNILFFFLISIPFAVKAQVSIEIQWEDLAPKMSYDDPFKKLTDYQLADLRYVVRVRKLESDNNEELTPAMRQKKDSLEKTLTEQGVDIEYLLSMRKTITELRKKESESTVTNFNGKKIAISGYLLPLNYVNEVSTQFLLVPWVGACIHTPPPPKNQIIYFEYNKGIKVTSRFEAVKLEGTLIIEEKVSELFLVDGSNDIATGYTISDLTVTNLN